MRTSKEGEGVVGSKGRLQLNQVLELDGEKELLDDVGEYFSDDGFDEDDGVGDGVESEDGGVEEVEVGEERWEDGEDDVVDDYDEALDEGDELDEELCIENDDDLNEVNDDNYDESGEMGVGRNTTCMEDGDIGGPGDGDGVSTINADMYTTPTKRNKGPVLPTPSVGISFANWEALNNYFRSYGEQQGFGVVCMGGNKSGVKDSETGKSNSLRTYVWRCECHGRPKYRRMVNGRVVTCAEEPILKRKTKKCSCPVMLYGARTKENLWVVKSVVTEHLNHIPTPTKSNHISMFRVRKITQTILKQIENYHDSGAPVAQIFNNLAGRRNGVENIVFTKKDVHNILNRRMRLRLRDGDAVAMINYLDKMTKDNQNFFHLHRLDKTGKFQDVMWVDARSRAAYEYFGDVVCFDSTYLTNKYDLPFSNFVGVNHHGKTILLGCALVSHETAETFVWLFRAWLSCMGGKAPAAIMTDQDAAMRKAIRIAMPMPKTRHLWCMWHIMQKFSRKLGSMTDFPQIKVALQTVIYNSLTPVEFEEGWAEVVETFKLKEAKESYKWLVGSYNQREMWIPVYVKHIFWAGMQTTQRVESINSFFDGYLKKNTRLYQFAPRYCKAMESRANDEKAADVNCCRFTRSLVGEFAVERKFQKLYTDAKFVEVQIQCMRVCYVTPITSKVVSDVEVEHTVSDKVWVWSKFLRKEISLAGRKRIYVVMFNKETSFAKCDCKHFECHGIMCRHC
ncbi:protein FAR-RED IMPAIRED RESPONSE 1 [Spinacia oleracea]|uniref:Protein FAR-RED IMPAIRED RESPONSE 1 n=1 Tax=Spinacia oleracea TaxID=3562 RepID=A0ABM3QWX6_SPIOL|nr:protein FAR-RED IMPAIRED RESPONSE 1-like [Spinacia oleracea]